MARTHNIGKQLKRGNYRSEKGKYYGTPKEVWGFVSRAAKASPEDVARGFLTANAALFELEDELAGLTLRRVIHSLGADHVIFSQVHDKLRVHRGYVTVHVDKSGRVFLTKNRSVPGRLLPGKFESRLTRDEAIIRARRTLPGKKNLARLQQAERIWFPYKDKLAPAWKVRFTRVQPREEWIVYVDARNGRLLSRYDNLALSSRGSALVFDPSPVTALGNHETLLTAKNRPRRPPLEAYRKVTLEGFSKSGLLTGKRVSTAPTQRRIRRPDRLFELRSHQRGFEEVMVYFHVDQALRYIEELGFTGPRAIFRKPVRANVTGTREDNSWYSPWDKLLTFGTGFVDDAEDAETIFHELGHAIQDAICPDFGQSAEAAAIGEGFGDYWAASFFEQRKPERYRQSVMTWDGLLIGIAEKLDPPSLRRMDSKLTFDDFVEDGDEHDNGPIWAATLWDVRGVLGRDAAARIVLESHFQLDGFTTFARAARAILDADRNLEGGVNEDALRRVFRRRKIGPL